MVADNHRPSTLFNRSASSMYKRVNLWNDRTEMYNLINAIIADSESLLYLTFLYINDKLCADGSCYGLAHDMWINISVVSAIYKCDISCYMHQWRNIVSVLNMLQPALIPAICTKVNPMYIFHPNNICM